mmetsp:Transcript_12953/g.23817  ORF Transcript_12953/g.23817 Transcript_12953/m.23817 type:complete len:365 (-) Transcript_12953:115-1209(-)
MIAPPPTRRVRCQQRFRTAIIASLAIIVVSLVASAPTASASTVPDKKCIEIKEDYDLRNAARNSNVFLIVHESDNKESREQICKKLEATPDKLLVNASEKGKGTVFAYLVISDPSEDLDGELTGGTKNFARNTLGVKNFPSFLYVSKGMDRYSKYSSHVTYYKGSELELSDVEKFIEKKVGFRLGNDVYNVMFFDSIAARFVSYGDATGLDHYKQRCLALLVRFSTLFSFREPFSSIGKLYSRAFSMSFENGMDYSGKQVEKLQKRLESNKSNLSGEKNHEFQQKIAILKAFSEPKELTAEDDKQIFIHAILHLGLLLATLLLLFLPSGDDSEAEEKKGEEVINAEPVVAKAMDGNDKSTKKLK